MSRPLIYRMTARKILLAFRGGKSARLGDLADKVGKSKASACRALQKLAKTGCVQRIQLTNQRGSLVFVRTEHGEKLCCVWNSVPWKPRKKRNVRTPREAFEGKN